MQPFPVVPRLLVLMAGWLGASLPAAALAQAAAPSGTTARSSPPITLLIELPPGSPLNADRLQGTIARELGVLVVRVPGAPGGTLVVRQTGESVAVSFDGPGGRHDGRAIPLPADATQAELDIAFVAVNVARDQTSALLVPPSPAGAPASNLATPAPSSEPPPAASTPCARLRASRAPRAPIGVDFVPYAGTSSFDRARSIRTVSVGVLGAVSSGVDGAAASGLANVEAGPVCGAQMAGLANVAMGLEGVQIGGIAGVIHGESAGLQVALVNVATAGRLRGMQVGEVNVASDASVQVGLVNVARDADVQVGLVNVDAHGRLHLDAWSKPEAGMFLLGIEHGPAHSHSIYAFEMNVTTGRPWAVFGFGAHLTPAEGFYVDIDLLQHVQVLPRSTSPNELSELRALVGHALAPHLSVFVGPTFNVLVASSLSRADAPGFAAVLGNAPTSGVRAWPGVAIGLEGL
jgi:hypothetical protein